MHTCTSGTFLTCPFPLLPSLDGTLVCVLLVAPDDLSDDDQLSHIAELEDETISIDSHDADEDLQNDKPVLISKRLLPIPAKLLKRVENGLFVEMAELSPSYSDSSDCSIDDQYAGPHKRPSVLKDIMDWVG